MHACCCTCVNDYCWSESYYLCLSSFFSLASPILSCFLSLSLSPHCLPPPIPLVSLPSPYSLSPLSPVPPPLSPLPSPLLLFPPLLPFPPSLPPTISPPIPLVSLPPPPVLPFSPSLSPSHVPPLLLPHKTQIVDKVFSLYYKAFNASNKYKGSILKLRHMEETVNRNIATKKVRNPTPIGSRFLIELDVQLLEPENKVVHTSEYVYLPKDSTALCHTTNFQWQKSPTVDVYFVVSREYCIFNVQWIVMLPGTDGFTYPLRMQWIAFFGWRSILIWNFALSLRTCMGAWYMPFFLLMSPWW